MRHGRVLSAIITVVLHLVPSASWAEEKISARQRSYTLPGASRLTVDLDLGGTRGISITHSPKPLSFRPSLLLGWKVAKDLRLGAELRHTGGTGVLVGLGIVWSLP